MPDRRGEAGRTEAGLELEGAAGVRRRHEIRAARTDRGDLPRDEAAGHLRMHDVVVSGAAAAEILVVHRDEAHARNAREQLAGLAANPLSVRQMTGVVVRDPHRRDGRRRSGRRLRGQRGEEFGGVAHARGERRGARRVGGIVASSAPYSFIIAPQPAALTITGTSPGATLVKASTFARASRSAVARSPA